LGLQVETGEAGEDGIEDDKVVLLAGASVALAVVRPLVVRTLAV
jgi:hypothetical protein